MAGAWLLSQSRRRFVLSAVFQRLFFLLPPDLPLANSAATFSLASPSVRFAGRCADCDCFARDFRGAAFFPSVFSQDFSEPSLGNLGSSLLEGSLCLKPLASLACLFILG